jgi:tagatose-1,6-bisphosphate aldolase
MLNNDMTDIFEAIKSISLPLYESMGLNESENGHIWAGDLVTYQLEGNREEKAIVLMGYETFKDDDEIRTDTDGIIGVADVKRVKRPKNKAVNSLLATWYVEKDHESIADAYKLVKLIRKSIENGELPSTTINLKN